MPRISGAGGARFVRPAAPQVKKPPVCTGGFFTHKTERPREAVLVELEIPQRIVVPSQPR